MLNVSTAPTEISLRGLTGSCSQGSERAMLDNIKKAMEGAAKYNQDKARKQKQKVLEVGHFSCCGAVSYTSHC